MAPDRGRTKTHNHTVVHATPGAISLTRSPGSPAHSSRLRFPEGERRSRPLACTATVCSPAANGPRCGRRRCRRRQEPTAAYALRGSSLFRLSGLTLAGVSCCHQLQTGWSSCVIPDPLYFQAAACPELPRRTKNLLQLVLGAASGAHR